MLAVLKWYLLCLLRNRVFATRALGVRVGEGCRILTSHFGSEPWLISIGDRVTVASGVRFVTHDGSTWLLRDQKGRRYRYAPIEIGSDVFIGVNAVIMPGVRIGDHCIVGAASLVNKSVPSGSIVAGVPARIIGNYDDYERRGLQFLPSAEVMKGNTPRERIESILEPAAPMMEAALPTEFLRS
jgi:acetyltransferase-like isoleucine patch superfamily enzyme